MGWFPANNAPELAFNHELELKGALKRLAELAVLTPAVFDLLPKKFSGAELEGLCREIFGKKLDRLRLLPEFKKRRLLKPCGKDGLCFAAKNFSPGCLGFLVAKPRQIC